MEVEVQFLKFTEVVLPILLFLLTSLVSNAQTDTEFWFVAPENSINGSQQFDLPVYLRITAFGQAAQVRVAQPANPAFVKKM